MPVYIDKLRDRGWCGCHTCLMVADTNEELHAFAERLRLKREWYEPSVSPRYHLTPGMRTLAVHLGAVELEDGPFQEITRRWRDAALARLWAAQSEEEKRRIRDELYR